jgi:glycosyltransferase involved in cell wall biosynthesis
MSKTEKQNNISALAQTEQYPFISVLIATRNRPEDLKYCLRSILAQAYPRYEVIVLDQSTEIKTADMVTEEFTDKKNLIYMPSHTVGKSIALNILLEKASGDIYALTDDDTETPPDWLQQIKVSFDENPDADILFGQVFPGKQTGFKGDYFVPSYCFSEKRRLKKGDVSGMGANMAIRKSIANKVNIYDPILGPGAAMHAAEEGDFIYRVQLSGGNVIHDPSIWLTHRAARSSDEWGRVYYSYGIGDSAFAMKHLRCGDVSIAASKTIHLAIMTMRLASRIIHRHTHQEEQYIRGFFHGIKLSFGYKVDRKLRLYIQLDKPNPGSISNRK